MLSVYLTANLSARSTRAMLGTVGSADARLYFFGISFFGLCEHSLEVSFEDSP